MFSLRKHKTTSTPTPSTVSERIPKDSPLQKLTVRVTKAHINHGDPRDAWNNPLCLAMIDAGFVKPSYFGAAFVNTVTGKRAKLVIPKQAQEASSNLCNEDIVSPFSFEVEYPDDVAFDNVAAVEDFDISL